MRAQHPSTAPVNGGGAQFPDVDERFDVQPRHLFGPFWRLKVTDTLMGRDVNVSGGGPLTGYGSVRRAARYSTRLYLTQLARRERREAR
ncbi:hypothetical protein [Curtobacterium ammoniigenes]|uniref:hypothetical protein n=1 Tax=Curtobacterium ammoniigenes TaxID=395387 RepID=UPI000833DF64|nr:hypothetical protein [Curtobacterium ammoniigenes]